MSYFLRIPKIKHLEYQFFYFNVIFGLLNSSTILAR